MNRRKFFPFIGIGSVAALLSPKLSASPAPHDDMWVEEVCTRKVDSGGHVVAQPNSSLWTSKPDPIYLEKMVIWNSLPECRVRYRRLRGSWVQCPKCGGSSSSPFAEKDCGIVV